MFPVLISATMATPVLPLLQVPKPPSDNNVVKPTQACVVPDIVPGREFTVTI